MRRPALLRGLDFGAPASRSEILSATLATSSDVIRSVSSGSKAARDSSASQIRSTSSRWALTLACSLARWPSAALLHTNVYLLALASIFVPSRK